MYDVIEIDSYLKVPRNSTWYGQCKTPKIGINLFEKNHPDLKIIEVYFNKTKKETYIVSEKKIEE
jgi:hypothetical protein